MRVDDRATRRRLRAAVLAALLSLSAAAVRADDPAYRTVVVMGDTQHWVDGGIIPELLDDPSVDLLTDRKYYRSSDPDIRATVEYASFRAMVDWVIANKKAQNIDFVMQVGDIITSGWEGNFPLPANCYDTSKQPPTCVPDPADDRRCDCGRVAGQIDDIDREWTRFRSQWDRLHDAHIPYAIVPGNHDNLGLRDGAVLGETRGYWEFFGSSAFSFAGSGHLGSHADRIGGLSHAWRFSIGDQPVLVLSLPWRWYRFQDPDTPVEEWVSATLSAHPHLPVVVLLHENVGRVSPTWIRIVRPHLDRVFWVAHGHAKKTPEGIVEMDGFRILRSVTDWQHKRGRDGSYLHLVRFYFNADEADEVEILPFSPVLGPGVEENPERPIDSLTRREFSIRREVGDGRSPDQ